VEYIRATCPDQFIIADAKRGDIGNTSELYARYFFDYLRADAVTVAPYMGSDSVRPFLREGKWVILLALTSNVGSSDFQLMPDASGVCLFERVIKVSQGWASPDQLMYVVGATQPELLRKIRRLAPDHFFLVPGVGAQGGSLELVCRYGLTAQCGLLVNASRSIIYASSGTDFAESATREARTMRDEMFSYLREYKII
jgi:orotidine-5'-phosphate decarboxylase